MFYPERIVSVKDGERVLEVGPGGSPMSRSDVLLELKYETEHEWIRQSGNVVPDQHDARTVFYDGGRFPFEDGAFDYVICSHVIEHVPDPAFFLQELMRVAKKGYLEFPTIYYDYIYNIPEHLNYVAYIDDTLKYFSKADSPLSFFLPVHKLLYDSLNAEVFDVAHIFKKYFFVGFEWFGNIPFARASSVAELCVPWEGRCDEHLQQKSGPQVGSEKPLSFIFRLKRKIKFILKI